MKSKQGENSAAVPAVHRGIGITWKLVAAIVVSVIIAVAALFGIVYSQMSRTLLEKSEDMLRTTTDKTLQETRAFMNKTLTMLECQRDTIEYENMDIPEMTEKIYSLAREIKDAFYGDRIVMFAPLYLSNYCVNKCVYCP